MTIIWDRSNVYQRARVVRKFLRRHRRLVTAHFPAYAPELNPDEGVLGQAKASMRLSLKDRTVDCSACAGRTPTCTEPREQWALPECEWKRGELL